MFFVKKKQMGEAIAPAKASHSFSTKDIGLFEILTFKILTKRKLTTSLVLKNPALMAKAFAGEKMTFDPEEPE